MFSKAEKIDSAITAEFHMISGSQDRQKSADVFNVGKFELPNPAGKAGGACTSALLKVLYSHNQASASISWVECLRKMRSELNSMGYDQVPELTSSRMIDVNKTMHIVPPGATGRRRAILIGINYKGQKGQLSGCHNDVHHIKRFLINVHKFSESEMLILCDDGVHHEPTRRNIENAFQRITQYSDAGDVVWISFSGHGGRVRDISGDEETGYDNTLIPLDFKRSGHIVDDDILNMLVKPMRSGVNVTVLMDCCHSGTVLDLPYRFSADDTSMRVRVHARKMKHMFASIHAGGTSCPVLLSLSTFTTGCQAPLFSLLILAELLVLAYLVSIIGVLFLTRDIWFPSSLSFVKAEQIDQDFLAFRLMVIDFENGL